MAKSKGDYVALFSRKTGDLEDVCRVEDNHIGAGNPLRILFRLARREFDPTFLDFDYVSLTDGDQHGVGAVYDTKQANRLYEVVPLKKYEVKSFLKAHGLEQKYP